MTVAKSLSAKEAQSLVRVDGSAIEKGDIVYEIVQYGNSPENARYNPIKVVSVSGGCVSGHRLTQGAPSFPIKVPFAKLRMEQREMTQTRTKLSVVNAAKKSKAAPASAEPLPAAVPVDDDYQTWLEMGRSLVADLSQQESELLEIRARVLSDIETLDASHRRVIEDLERELVKAKAAHAEDRALAETRRDGIDVKLARLTERKAGLNKMLGEVS